MPTKPVNTRANRDFINVTLCKLLCYLYTDWIQNGYRRKKIENEKEKKKEAKK
jgi:hypothetical protein